MRLKPSSVKLAGCQQGPSCINWSSCPQLPADSQEGVDDPWQLGERIESSRDLGYGGSENQLIQRKQEDRQLAGKSIPKPSLRNVNVDAP